MSKDTSGPAFPVSIPAGHYWTGDAPYGLTKREWYAGLAMQGMIASQTPDESIATEMCAQWCFEMADAMLAEGNKR